MDIKDVIKKVENLYSNGIINKVPNHLAVGWKSKEEQYLRFQKLLMVISDKSKPISLLDFGCGYGELLLYLLNNGFNISKYYGIDISLPMLIEFKKNYNISPFKNYYLFLTDKLNLKLNFKVDYVVVSGTFNVKFEISNKEYKKYVIEKLREISEVSLKGFSFNLLTKYVDYKRKHLFYADPLFFFDYCKRNFSKYVSLIHDYPLYEFTILVYKK